MGGSKKAGFTKDEIKLLSSLSQDQLDNLIYAKRGLPENKISANAGGEGVTFSQQTGLSTMPQGNLVVDKPTVQPANIADSDVESTIQQLEQAYLDPTTLESRAWYANGTSPEKAIHKTVDGSTWERIKLSFSNKSPKEQIPMLEKTYGKGNVAFSKGKNLTIRDPKTNSWYQLDPVGAGEGDFIDKALEKTRDVLADNAALIAGVGAGIVTGGAVLPALAGAGAIGSAIGVGAAAGYGSATTRVVLGRLMGTYEATAEETLKDVGLETVLSAAGNAILPGVAYTTRTLGGMFKKAAPVLEQAAKESPQANQKLIKLIGTLSGQGDEYASQVINNSSKVGTMMTKFGKDPTAAMQENISQVKQLSKEIVEARNSFGKEIYSNFAKEAGEHFNPSVVRTFTGVADDQAFDVVKKGILKWNPNELKLSINSADDIMRANPELGSVFAQDGAGDVLKPVVNIVNRWNQVKSASGSRGGEQFLAFKQQLGAALRQSQVIAEEKGLTQAFSEVVQFTDQLKSQYLNRSLDLAKNKPEIYQKLLTQLSNADAQYAQVKKVIKPFEDALRRDSSKAAGEAFQSVYNATFKAGKISARNAVAKGNLQSTIELLGKYKPSMVEIMDDIGARDAAVAFSPWTRGGLETAFSVGAVASGSPAGIAMMAARSPRLNYEAARLLKSSYEGMDFVRKMTPDMKKAFLTSGEAIDKLHNTITTVPALEGQIAAQAAQQLKNNGQ